MDKPKGVITFEPSNYTDKEIAEHKRIFGEMAMSDTIMVLTYYPETKFIPLNNTPLL